MELAGVRGQGVSVGSIKVEVKRKNVNGRYDADPSKETAGDEDQKASGDIVCALH
jgi:hypothetical protein